MAQSVAGRLTMPLTAAIDALADLSGWSDANTVVHSNLGGSDTNRCWIIERSGERYVLRLDTPLVDTLGLDRQRESQVCDVVARAGLAPAVVVAYPDRGITISEYKAGRTWTRADLHDADNLARLATCLNKLHALPPVGRPFSLSDAVTQYAERLGDHLSMSVATQVHDLLGRIHPREPVLCHNDLVAQNVIAGEQLWLIDWEYAGVGDPLFDLAVVVEHHQIPTAMASRFVAQCFGDVRRTDQEDLARYRSVYRRVVSLWRALVALPGRSYE